MFLVYLLAQIDQNTKFHFRKVPFVKGDFYVQGIHPMSIDLDPQMDEQILRRNDTGVSDKSNLMPKLVLLESFN